MKQYEVFELVFHGGEPEGSCAAVELEGEFILNGSSTAVKGFYAGDQRRDVFSKNPFRSFAAGFIDI